MVAVFDASRGVDRFDWVITVDDVRREFDHLHNCDPVQDMRVAEVDGLAGEVRIRYGRPRPQVLPLALALDSLQIVRPGSWLDDVLGGRQGWDGDADPRDVLQRAAAESVTGVLP